MFGVDGVSRSSRMIGGAPCDGSRVDADGIADGRTLAAPARGGSGDAIRSGGVSERRSRCVTGSGSGGVRKRGAGSLGMRGGRTDAGTVGCGGRTDADTVGAGGRINP